MSLKTKPRAESEPVKGDSDKPDESAEDKKDPPAAEDENCADDEEDKDKEKSKKAKAEDGDEEPGAEDDEKKEDAKARAELAQVAGLNAADRPSLRRIAAAISAKTVSLSALGTIEAEVAELKQKLEDREKGERKAAAKAFAAKAVEDGCTTEDKRARVEAEHAEKGEKAAKDLLFPRGTFSALRRFTDGKGNPIGKKDEAVNFAQAEPAEIEAAMSAKAREIAAEKKISLSAAQDLIKTEAPELYAAYRAIRR